jgi:hypothetical protein
MWAWAVLLRCAQDESLAAAAEPCHCHPGLDPGSMPRQKERRFLPTWIAGQARNDISSRGEARARRRKNILSKAHNCRRGPWHAAT